MSVMVGPIVLPPALPGAGGGRSRRRPPPSGVGPSRCGYGGPRARYGGAARRGSRGRGLRPAVRHVHARAACRPCSRARLPARRRRLGASSSPGRACAASRTSVRTGLRLRTVNGRDVTSSFPELVEPLTRRAPRGRDGARRDRRRGRGGRPAAAPAAAAAHGDRAPVGRRAAPDAGRVDRRRPAVARRPRPGRPALPAAPGAARGARPGPAAGRRLADVPRSPRPRP